MGEMDCFIDDIKNQALQKDDEDTLAHFRDKFHIPRKNGKDVCYLTGNSLGLQPREARRFIEEELEVWRSLAVDGHFNGKRPWFDYHLFFSDHLAHLTGARASECVAMGSLTANLHFLMVSFYQPRGNRFKILCENKPFPSDLYAFSSQARFHGFDPQKAVVQLPHLEMSEEEIADYIEYLGDSLAVVILGGVHFLTGRRFNLKKIAESAHKVGAYFGTDLAHAIGNVPLSLHDHLVDFACWCSYKYLNSGPGAVGGIFVHEKYFNNREIPRLEGWWGADAQKRFLMEDTFIPAEGAQAWQLSNAPVINMAAHLCALEIFSDAQIQNLRLKSIKLTAFLDNALRKINELFDREYLKILTPGDPEQRGCQLSVEFKEKSKDLYKYLLDQGIIVDWREPGIVRMAPVPLYNKFSDIALTIETIINFIKKNF